MADEDGKFTLIGLESGNCEVWARGQTHLQSQRQVVQAGATGVSIELPRAGRIEGVAVDAETDEPIQQYTLLITGNQDIIIPSRMYRRRVKDPEGKFVFDGLLQVENLQLDSGNPLQDELAEFVDCVRTRRAPTVPGTDGVAALAAAQRVLEVIAENRWE